LEPINYEVLLVVAGLALYTRLGFAIKPTAWRSSLVGINLQPTIALLSWNKKRLTLMHTLMRLSHGAADDDTDENADVDADDDTAMQMMDDNIDNNATRRQ
jgi:hypothetical protein